MSECTHCGIERKVSAIGKYTGLCDGCGHARYASVRLRLESLLAEMKEMSECFGPASIARGQSLHWHDKLAAILEEQE